LTVTLLAYGDAHSGSSVGLCPPNIKEDDGQKIKYSISQRWIWDNWLRMIEKAKSFNNDLISLSNGDSLEGNTNNKSYQVVTSNPVTLIKIGVESHGLVRRISKRMYMTRGTGFHSGKSGNLEELLATSLACEKTDEGMFSAYQWNLMVEGVTIEATHHTTMSGIPWMKEEAADKLAAKIMFANAKAGETPPDIVIRSHVHRWSDSYDKYKTRVIILPCWCLPTEHIHKVAPSSIAEIGAVFIHIDGKKFEVEKFKVIPKRKIWRKI